MKQIYEKALAMGRTMTIVNPCQEQLMHAMFAADMLLHHPNADVTFVDKMNAANTADTVKVVERLLRK